MKTCPSCGSELADDALECLCGYSYEEAADDLEDLDASDGEDALHESEGMDEVDEGADEAGGVGRAPGLMSSFESGPPPTKPCVFCGSEIATPALRCAHCSGFLPIAEGTIFKQYFFFLFACLAMTIGALLPWERTFLKGNLTGADSIQGGFLLLFAGYGLITSFWNIYHRKMIVWPVLLAALDGAIAGWSRTIALASDVVVVIPTGSSAFYKFVVSVKTYVAAFGPGLYLVTIFSTLVLLSVVISVFQGAKQDARRKADEREMRAATRKRR